MSIRARLTLWIVFAMALALSGLGATVYYRARADLLRTVDRDLNERAARMMPGGRPRAFGERPGPPPFGERGRGPQGAFRPRARERGEGRPPGPPPGGGRPPGPGWRFAPLFIHRDGQVFGPPDRNQPWDRAAFTRALNGKPIYSTVTANDEPVRVLSQPVAEDGTVERVIQVAHPLADTYQALTGLTRTLLTLIPVALLVAAVGGALLIDRVLRPVRQITHTAKDIGVADLSKRLPVTGKDEFSELASTFNAMLGRLQSAFARLEEIVERQRRFTGDASHELRTPLAIVKANTTLALSTKRTPEDYQAALQAVDGAANRMNKIVLDLLMLARSDGGQLGQNVKITPVSEVLARAVEIVSYGSNVGQPEHAAVKVQISDGTSVVGNEDELTRLFANLLENAARHTPPDGEIYISASAENGHVRVAVEDNGEGIPAEHLPHVCDRFYRVDSSRSRNGSGGTGLGLAICKSIVDAHRGTMTIASEVGRGTIVAVTLPTTTTATAEPR